MTWLYKNQPKPASIRPKPGEVLPLEDLTEDTYDARALKLRLMQMDERIRALEEKA